MGRLLTAELAYLIEEINALRVSLGLAPLSEADAMAVILDAG